MMIAVLVGQYRLTPLGNKKVYREKHYRHRDFPLVLKFLKIRALVDAKLVDTYTEIREQSMHLIPHGPKRHHHSPPSKGHHS